MKEGVFLRGSGPLVSKILVEKEEGPEALAMGAVAFGDTTLESLNSSPWITRNRILSCEGSAPDHSAIWCEGVTDARAQIEDNLIEVASGGTGIWCRRSDPLIAGNRLRVGLDGYQGMSTTGILCATADPLIVGNRLRQGEEATGIAATDGAHPTIVNNDANGQSLIAPTKPAPPTCKNRPATDNWAGSTPQPPAIPYRRK